jgi:hypothetical protein
LGCTTTTNKLLLFDPHTKTLRRESAAEEKNGRQAATIKKGQTSGHSFFFGKKIKVVFKIV